MTWAQYKEAPIFLVSFLGWVVREGDGEQDLQKNTIKLD
jgi:hypothetical protein